ncbi:MAG TPA: helix-turn-helix transcriptional regulator [Clostridiaceae bacterium]|nr:helix-turn-helix transcriptional regulator [Clostridiaceae bacterium]
MKLSDAIRKRIKYYLKIQDMKIWDLCKATGIPCSTISTFISGKTELIKLDTLLHICEGFNISLGEFFTDSIFDNTYQENNKD